MFVNVNMRIPGVADGAFTGIYGFAIFNVTENT
jgi:hypothetical protein